VPQRRHSASNLTVFKSPKFAQAIEYNITYAQGQNCTLKGYAGPCTPMNLQLDVHQPVRNDSVKLDPPPLKPAVVFFHGGGWAGGDKSGAGGQPFMTAQCQRWTSRGFVVFNADYRLDVGSSEAPCGSHAADGSNARYSVCGDFPPCCEGPSRAKGPCMYDAFHAPATFHTDQTQCPPYASAYPASRDAKAAVRFVRKNAAKYGVSPDHLVALGCSAGGWTATTLAIAAEEEWRDEMLGHDPTLESTNLEVSSKVQAAVVMSGGPRAYDQRALALGAMYQQPYDKTDAPMIMLHGHDDPVVNVSNVERNREGYARSGVPFEAHVFPNTKHCEKNVESESTVVQFSIPFVAKHLELQLLD